jgi:hypothetical protein
LLAQHICDAEFSAADCGEADPLLPGSGSGGSGGFNCDTGVTPFVTTPQACALYLAPIALLFAAPPPPPAPPSCDDLLAGWIDSYLTSYNGITRGSPLATLGGAYFVRLGQQTGVDPAFILGIARSESSLATNPKVNGGKYNVYGNSLHFNGKTLYTNYADPTVDAFNLIKSYIGQGLTTSYSAYKNYEGAESNWETNLGYLQTTQKALFGNTENIRYDCDDARRGKLAGALRMRP